MRRILFLFIWLVLAFILLSSLSPSNVCADGINFNSQLHYSTTESKTTNRTTGDTSKTDTYRFDQRYNFNVSKTIYPYLRFLAGTRFEWNNTSSKTEDTKVDREETILRPFVGLRLDNPLYRAGLEYNRTEIHEDTTGLPKTEDIKEEITARLGWKPIDLPDFDLNYRQTHTYDDPETIDTIDRLLTLQTTYTVWQQLSLDYTYTRREEENRLENFDTLQQTHLGSTGYSNSFLDRRLSLNTTYRIRYDTLEFPGAETVESPLQRSEGLFSLDSTPIDDFPPLGGIDALIDGNLTASTGIDIGRAGDRTTFTNIGINFGVERQVDQIRIWVDRRLTEAVANSFSWDIYTSPDNTEESTWTLRATVSPADFGTFDNRFEILFPPVNTQFIKVVTTPLSPAVPGADDPRFANIFVTEIQAFVTLSGAEVDNKRTTTEHNYDLNLSARLTDKTVANYSLQYSHQQEDFPSRKRSELFNNISFSHRFNQIFSARTRFSHTAEEDNGMDTTTYSYGAAVTGSYLPTFNQTLTLNGTNVKEEEGSTYTYSAFLRNNAILYRGWSAFADLGYRRNLSLNDTRTTSKNIRLGTNMVPNDKITFNLDYSYTLTDLEESDGSTEKNSFKNLDMQVFFNPFRTLSITARLTYVRDIDLGSPNQQYFITWSPFPDGSVQLFSTFSETRNPDQDQRDRSLGSGFNWTISRHFTVEMFYSITRSKTRTQEIDANTLRAELRINL